MVAIVQKLIDGYPSVVNAENKNTQVSCWIFFLNVLHKLRKLDTFLIPYVRKYSKKKNFKIIWCSAACLWGIKYGDKLKEETQ